MKILIVVESLQVKGGSEKFAANLGTKLFDKGYDVSYLTLMDLNPKYHFKGNYYTLNEDDIYANVFKRSFDLFRYAPKITELCKERSFEIILSVSEVANFHAVLSRYLFGNKVPIIASQHINPEIFLKSPLKSNLIKFFYKHADKTVCVSKDIERVLNEKFGVKNTEVIYNMMNLNENIQLSLEKPHKEHETLFEKNNFHFITVGRLTRQKGHWFLIRSFRKVVDKHPNTRLFIIGDGNLKTKLKTLIKVLDLDKHVFLLGEQENIFPFLKNSDCFTFTSLWEGFGLVLTEALSLNLPVISTDCRSGPREVLCPELDLNKDLKYPYFCKYGVLTDIFPNEINLKSLNENPLIESELMLADLMIEIIENPKLRENYSHGQDLAEIFNDDKIVNHWIKILLDAVV